ncbi:MAG TPA: sigma-70 family RNA polymerase sigma factor [Opitutaceae bacterium]|nr:sigma-70 family RNA polymerase sigma factor [Opitutaceae bacterium]
MKSDSDLLREFALNQNQACFAEVVQRHVGFVYGVCVRRLRDPGAAQDAAQAVFIALARKARTVADAPSLLGWLHRSAYYQTQHLMRSEKNRIARESVAHRLGTTVAETRDSRDEMNLVIDDVLRELSEVDREAIMARFFAEQSYAAVGAKLRLTENAARMRVERAMQRMRSLLEQRGICSTAAAIAAALPGYATAQVPVGLMAAITRTSIAAAAGGGGMAAFIGFMSTGKIIAGAVVAASVAGFVWEKSQNRSAEAELAAAHAALASTDQRIEGLEAKISELQRDLEASSAKSAQKIASTPPRSADAKEGPVPIPGVTPKAPKGWFQNGSANELYEVGVDENNSWGGMPSAYAKSIGEAGGKFGGMMQTISADAYRGQRVQLTGWMKTQDAANGGNLWMRVDGQGHGNMLQFDNMQDRAPKGTTDWEEYSIVLDVPAEATTVNYGFFVAGKGQVWVNGVTITPVSTQVPSTDVMKKNAAALPTTPVNLGFSPLSASK